MLESIPENYPKHIESSDGLYEIWVTFGRDIFRIFCFFDRGKLVVLTNGFQKKIKKTLKVEIRKALKIVEEYFNESK